jgi:hypothetical protein
MAEDGEGCQVTSCYCGWARQKEKKGNPNPNQERVNPSGGNKSKDLA